MGRAFVFIRKLIALIACGVALMLWLGLRSGFASQHDDNTSWLYFQLAMSPGLSIREQHLNQEILDRLLLAAARLPDVTPCELRRPLAIDPLFGEFAVIVDHPSLARRITCLRGVVRYLLQANIAEDDFEQARASEVRLMRPLSEPDPKYTREADRAAERLAFLSIYQKYSPLYQLHSVDAAAFSALSFDEFNLWLERNRRSGRFSFFGQDALLQALDLPVPDRMVLQLGISLVSSRAPAGISFFDGERFGIPALIMVLMDRNDHDGIHRIRQRLSCDSREPSNLDPAYDAIERGYCSIGRYFSDTWFTLALRKADGAGFPEFCREVQDLTKDADLATMIRFSLDGSKGLYVFLPAACKPSE